MRARNVEILVGFGIGFFSLYEMKLRKRMQQKQNIYTMLQ